MATNAQQQTAVQTERLAGYHGLADLMGPYPSCAIFRRFGALNSLNLLSLQAELVELDALFRTIVLRDNRSTDESIKMLSSNFRELRASKETDNGDQYRVLLQIRGKLAAYNAAVLQVSQLEKLARPQQTDLAILRGWLIGKKEGNGFLRGSEVFTWHSPSAGIRCQKELEKDFVTFSKAAHGTNPFSRQLTSRFLSWYHNIWGSRHGHQARIVDVESGVVDYDDQSIARLNVIVISVMSSALPVLAIAALYCIHTDAGRIGAMVAFTVTFAVSLATFTNARMLEIFASKSAFAAVEVVFIGATITSGQFHR